MKTKKHRIDLLHSTFVGDNGKLYLLTMDDTWIDIDFVEREFNSINYPDYNCVNKDIDVYELKKVKRIEITYEVGAT